MVFLIYYYFAKYVKYKDADLIDNIHVAIPCNCEIVSLYLILSIV